MFDPEYKESSKGSLKIVPTEPKPNIRVMDERDKQRWYVKNCALTQKYYGLCLKDGKLAVANLERVKSFDEPTKQMLRDCMRETTRLDPN